MKKTIALIILTFIVLLFNGCTDSNQKATTFIQDQEPITTANTTKDSTVDSAIDSSVNTAVYNSADKSSDSSIKSTAGSKTNAIEIGWKYETSTNTDENGTEVPVTNISLLINGKIIEIGQYIGYPRDVSNLEGANMPKESILACKTWFGGAGNDIYIKKGDNQTLVAMSREVDEGGKQDFKNIKEIRLENAIEEIKIINASQQ